MVNVSGCAARFVSASARGGDVARSRATHRDDHGDLQWRYWAGVLRVFVGLMALLISNQRNLGALRLRDHIAAVTVASCPAP